MNLLASGVYCGGIVPDAQVEALLALDVVLNCTWLRRDFLFHVFIISDGASKSRRFRRYATNSLTTLLLSLSLKNRPVSRRRVLSEATWAAHDSLLLLCNPKLGIVSFTAGEAGGTGVVASRIVGLLAGALSAENARDSAMLNHGRMQSAGFFALESVPDHTRLFFLFFNRDQVEDDRTSSTFSRKAPLTPACVESGSMVPWMP